MQCKRKKENKNIAKQGEERGGEAIARGSKEHSNRAKQEKKEVEKQLHEEAKNVWIAMKKSKWALTCNELPKFMPQ